MSSNASSIAYSEGGYYTFPTDVSHDGFIVQAITSTENVPMASPILQNPAVYQVVRYAGNPRNRDVIQVVETQADGGYQSAPQGPLTIVVLGP